MAWLLTWYSLISFCGAIGALGLCGVAYRHRSEPAASRFAALCLAIAAWSITYGVQIGFTDRAMQLSFQVIVFAIAATVPPLWLYFTVEYAGVEQWLTRRRVTLLAAEPVVFFLVELTNGSHGLVWTDAVLVTQGSVPVLELSFGAGYVVHVAYVYTLVAVGLWLLVRTFGRVWSLYRRQTALLIAGALPPFVAHISYSINFHWGRLPGLDYTPVAFVLTVGAFGLAMYRFDLLDRVPLAHERMIAETGDGLVVLDDEWTVVDANVVARRVFDPTPVPGSVFTPPDSFDRGGSLENGTTEILEVETDGRSAVYDTSVTTLTDHHGRTAGYVMILQDVTDRHAYEQRLEVTNRVLRHNLRNDMNKIIGYAELVEEGGPQRRREAADQIIETAYDLVDLSEKAGLIGAIKDDAADDPVAVDVAESVTTVLAGFRDEHPRVSFEQQRTEELWAALSNPSLLTVALTNLVENAVEHNDGPDPSVTVTIDRSADDDRVGIRIRDNGPGIPSNELTVIESGNETPLVHGSGVGLWLVQWSVEAAGGRVTFETPPSGGTVVTLTWPAADGQTVDAA